MNPISLLPQAGWNYKLYYLVPVSFVYVFSITNAQVHLIFALIALIGAASRHSMGEAMYGPGGEEERELDPLKRIQRTGTVIFRDKAPSAYSATSYQEMVQEGNLSSKYWGGFLLVNVLFQASLSVMYVGALYFLFTYRSEIGFVGGVILFSLVALFVYGLLAVFWPDVHRIHDDFPSVDPALQNIVNGFVYSLNAEDISVPDVYYEPDGGRFEIDCRIDDDATGQVEKKLNQIAFSFCSIVDRSPYPVDQAKIVLQAGDTKEIEFLIEARWCRRLLSGDLSANQYRKRVRQSLVSKSEDALEELNQQ